MALGYTHCRYAGEVAVNSRCSCGTNFEREADR